MILVFNCTTDDDFESFQKNINRSKIEAISSGKENKTISFNCESQREADKMETVLQFLTDMFEICGYFETEK